MLALDDLFVVGLALEISAAWLLGRGLIGSPHSIALRNAKHGSKNCPVDVQRIVDEAIDRIDASTGIRLLLFGFVVQAVAYTIALSTELSTDPDTSRAAFAAVLCAGLVLAVLLGQRLLRDSRLKRLLAEVAVEVQTIYSSDGWSEPGVIFLVEAARSPQIDSPPEDPGSDTGEWLQRVFPVAIRKDSYRGDLVVLDPAGRR